MSINSECHRICFVCLQRGVTSPEVVDFFRHESGASKPDPAHFSIYSLKSLSHFLGLDMPKLLKIPNNISPHLLKKVTEAALKAELCENCFKIINNFSQLHQQFEKIRIELMSCLRDIHEKLMEATVDDRADEIIKVDQGQEHPMTKSGNTWLDKLDVLKFLRTQIIEKSSRLICSSTPRIKVENLTMKEVDLQRLMIKQMSTEGIIVTQSSLNESEAAVAPEFRACREAHTPEIEIGNIKLECPTGRSTPKDDDSDWDDSSNYSDNLELHDDDDTSSDLSEEEPIVAEMKVDAHHIRVSSTPTSQLNTTKLVAAPNISSPKLATTKDFSPVKVQGKFQCNCCLKQFTTKRRASEHFNNAHLKLRYKCRNCDKVFSTQAAHKGHHRAVHQGDWLRCKNCNMGFVTKQNLERHQRFNICTFKKQAIKRHTCQSCDKSYTKMIYLKSHINAVHLRSSRFACAQCDKVFIKPSHRKAHINTVHKGIREHFCNLCPKRYTSKFNLKYHKVRVHASEPMPP